MSKLTSGQQKTLCHKSHYYFRTRYHARQNCFKPRGVGEVKGINIWLYLCVICAHVWNPPPFLCPASHVYLLSFCFRWVHIRFASLHLQKSMSREFSCAAFQVLCWQNPNFLSVLQKNDFSSLQCRDSKICDRGNHEHILLHRQLLPFSLSRTPKRRQR